MEKKEKILQEIELKEHGFMKMELDSFFNSTCHEDRVIGFIGQGKEIEVFVIGKEKLNKMGFNYKNCVDDFPEIKFFNQRLGNDELEISSEQNVELYEKYESGLTKAKMTSQKNNTKTKRSVKGLRN